MIRTRDLKSRGLTAIALGAAISSFGGVARASLIASDTVTNNPPYNGYIDFNGLNGGYGFGPWSATNTTGSSGGDFTWFNTPLNSPGNGGGFDIYDNGTQNSPTAGTTADEFSAIRPFTGALAAGQVFSFNEQLNNGSNASNGGPANLGFSLDDSSGNALFDFHVQGGGAGYLLTDATQSGVTESTVPYNYHAIDTFSFALDSVGATSATYTFTASGGNVSGGSQSFTGTISMLTGGITQADIYNNNGGQGSDVQFDDLAITNVPEPISFAMTALGTASLLIRRRRDRR